MDKTKSLINVYSTDWLPHSPLFTNSFVRGFISESGVIFNHVQRVSRNQELLNHSELNKASRKYRSVIHSWFIKLVDNLNDQSNPHSVKLLNEFENLSKTLHQMEIAWHLCEILYIDIRSAGTLLVQLLNWVKWHFTYNVDLADKVIVVQVPELHENYWDVLIFFALIGEMENASLFLQLHSQSKTNVAFIIMQDLLKKFPVLSNNQALHEYYLRWGIWHESVVQAINDDKIPIDENSPPYMIKLNLLLHLLAGDLEAFKKVKYLFHSWYQMMVSYAIFTYPCLKGNLDSLIEEFISIFFNSNNTEIDPFDELIRSAFSYDLMDVIRRSSMCFEDNWWFVTHFIDLICNSSRFSDYQIADICQIRDAFVVDYANSLFSQPKQFWQLSIEYLLNYKNSRDHIRLVLERIPFNTDHELQKLLYLTKRFDFPDLGQSICKIQCQKLLQKAKNHNREKYGSALFWAVRSKDKMLINFIVDQFLKHYAKTANENALKSEKLISEGELLDSDIISNIGSEIVLSERLIFLYKYHEFHQHKNCGQYSQAAKIIVDMLASNAIPEFFTFQVILNCLPLLEAQNVVIDSEQTSKILSSLEQILSKLKCTSDVSTFFEIDPNSSVDDDLHQIKEYQRKILEKFENTLRLSIARNLSRNFVLIPETNSLQMV